MWNRLTVPMGPQCCEKMPTAGRTVTVMRRIPRPWGGQSGRMAEGKGKLNPVWAAVHMLGGIAGPSSIVISFTVSPLRHCLTLPYVEMGLAQASKAALVFRHEPGPSTDTYSQLIPSEPALQSKTKSVY